jgi:probable phosphoglycerate mutase
LVILQAADSDLVGMASTTYVLLIRHGENEYVSTHRLAGRTPAVHLNEKGHGQARELVTLLDGQRIDAIYSSPLERCHETAAPLAAARGLPVQPLAGVVEVDYGKWQGQDLRELGKLPEWQQVQHYPSSFRFPAGETLREVQTRSVATLERICHDHPDQVVAVFSHGDVIRTTLAHFLGVPLDLFQRIVISTASVSVLAFHDGRPSILGMNALAAMPRCEIKHAAAEQSEPEGPAGDGQPAPGNGGMA